MAGEVALQNNNKDLFVDSSGNQIVFFMRPCSERQLLKPLIEQAGGKITSKITKDCIKLAEKGSTITRDDYISTKFIHDCLQEGKIVDKINYKITPGKQNISDSEKSFASFSSNDSMSPASYVIQTQARDQKGRTAYTKEEDLAMMKYLVESNQYLKATGNTVWRDMEQLKVTNHTAASMNTRFRKTIRPNLDRYKYDIPHHWRSLLTGILPKADKDSVFSFEDLFSSKVGQLVKKMNVDKKHKPKKEISPGVSSDLPKTDADTWLLKDTANRSTKGSVVSTSSDIDSSPKVVESSKADRMDSSPSKSLRSHMTSSPSKLRSHMTSSPSKLRTRTDISPRKQMPMSPKEQNEKDVSNCSRIDADSVNPTHLESNQKPNGSDSPVVTGEFVESTPETVVSVLSDGQLQLSQDTHSYESGSDSDIPKIIRRSKRNVGANKKDDQSVSEYFSTSPKEKKVKCQMYDIPAAKHVGDEQPRDEMEVTITDCPQKDASCSASRKIEKAANVNASNCNDATCTKDKSTDVTCEVTSTVEGLDSEDSLDEILISYVEMGKPNVIPVTDDDSDRDLEDMKQQRKAQTTASKLATKIQKSQSIDQATTSSSNDSKRKPAADGNTGKQKPSLPMKQKYTRKKKKQRVRSPMGDDDGDDSQSRMHESEEDGGPDNRHRSDANVYSFDDDSERDGEITDCIRTCRTIANNYGLHCDHVQSLLWRNCGNVNRTIKWIKYGIYSNYPPAWREVDDDNLQTGEEMGPLSCRYGDEEMKNRLVFLEGLGGQ